MSNHDLEDALFALEDSFYPMERAYKTEKRRFYFRIVTDVERIVDLLHHRKALNAKTHWTPTSAHQMASLALRQVVSKAFPACHKARLLSCEAKQTCEASIPLVVLEDACSLLPMGPPAPISFEDHALPIATSALEHARFMAQSNTRSYHGPEAPFRIDAMPFSWVEEFVMVKELINLINHYLNVTEKCGLTHVGEVRPVGGKRLPDWTCPNCDHVNPYGAFDCRNCWFVNRLVNYSYKKQKK